MTDMTSEPMYPLAAAPAFTGAWINHRGTPVSLATLDKVDDHALAQAYASETDETVALPDLDPATREAWISGWRNPRVREADKG